MFNAFTVHKLC